MRMHACTTVRLTVVCDLRLTYRYPITGIGTGTAVTAVTGTGTGTEAVPRVQLYLSAQKVGRGGAAVLWNGAAGAAGARAVRAAADWNSLRLTRQLLIRLDTLLQELICVAEARKFFRVGGARCERERQQGGCQEASDDNVAD